MKVVYETPLRVFAVSPQNTSVEFCDYLFPDETLVDSANRFRDLIGIDVDENSIDETVEHVPSELRTIFSSSSLVTVLQFISLFSDAVPFDILLNTGCGASNSVYEHNAVAVNNDFNASPYAAVS